ncbi:hypothetical protein TNCT_379001 [Trichonephila clavata]|uniref:Uncharacterized protein n=1 Tax=Trichonephila clavata TaxID=2740835 RepID=A0A8X6GSW0_TRICU|nr:hypothetical protein TNCT_379001 [Trichonephila clavata]
MGNHHERSKHTANERELFCSLHLGNCCFHSSTPRCKQENEEGKPKTPHPEEKTGADRGQIVQSKKARFKRYSERALQLPRIGAASCKRPDCLEIRWLMGNELGRTRQVQLGQECH